MKPFKKTMLVVDESHRIVSDTFIKIFDIVDYKLFLGLTATLERLDNKHKLILKKCPIIDTITVEEAIKNKWLSDYKEYKIEIEVSDIDTYNENNKKFYKYFEFFNNDFNLAMSCAAGSFTQGKRITPEHFRSEYLKKLYTGTNKETKQKFEKLIVINAFGFIRELKARKNFILSHPKKIEITNLILEHRKDKKAITFSPTLKVADKIKYGNTLGSATTKSKNRITKEEFIKCKTGVLNTSKMANEGVDIQGVNLLIILSNTSSKTEKTQRIEKVLFKPI